MAKGTSHRGVCLESGCERDVWSRSYCHKHYERRAKDGTLPPKIVLSPEERLRADMLRFLSYVDVNGPTMPHMTTNCHVWTGGLNRQNYGKFSYQKDRVKITVGAHKRGWEMFVGSIPPETPFVCHECDNPYCVRLGEFGHLWLGTHADNTADMVSKGRQVKGELNSESKLTTAQVIEIRRRAPTERNASLGREFGVTKTTIGYIVKGKTWKHLL